MKKGKHNPQKKQTNKYEKDSVQKEMSEKESTEDTSKHSKMEFENVTKKMLGRVSVSFMPPSSG